MLELNSICKTTANERAQQHSKTCTHTYICIQCAQKSASERERGRDVSKAKTAVIYCGRGCPKRAVSVTEGSERGLSGSSQPGRHGTARNEDITVLQSFAQVCCSVVK